VVLHQALKAETVVQVHQAALLALLSPALVVVVVRVVLVLVLAVLVAARLVF